MNNLITFALVGTLQSEPLGGDDGSGGGTYPPGWFATPIMTATAAPGATPLEEAVTKPTKPAAAENATPEGAEEAPTKKKGIPGFTVVFAIAGLLEIAYVLMRRRE